MNDISIAAAIVWCTKKELDVPAPVKKIGEWPQFSFCSFPLLQRRFPPNLGSPMPGASASACGGGGARAARPIQILIWSIWSIVSHFGRGRRRHRHRRCPIKTFYNYYAANKVERNGCGPLAPPPPLQVRAAR